MDSDLLDILVCPETKQPLRPATDEELATLNGAIASGGLETVGGAPVTQPVSEGLVREDGRRLYPVREGIPIMLIDEAIPLGDGA